MHFSQHILCTGKMELALDVKFYLDFHCVTRPWRRTPTNGSDVNYVFPHCRHYQSEREAGSQSLITPRRLGSFGGKGIFERIPKERRIHPLFVVRLGRIGFELSLPGYDRLPRRRTFCHVLHFSHWHKGWHRSSSERRLSPASSSSSSSVKPSLKRACKERKKCLNYNPGRQICVSGHSRRLPRLDHRVVAWKAHLRPNLTFSTSPHTMLLVWKALAVLSSNIAWQGA